MEWLKLSYHSIGTLTASILSFLLTFFLLTKKNKTAPTWWLAGLFAGIFSIFLGYFLAYSVYAPWGAYHRYLTVGVLFGIMSMIQFSYVFPRNEHPRESKIVLILSLIASFGAWGHFVFKTSDMEKVFNFDAHFFTFDYGKEAGIVIALEFLWIVIVLLRKTIIYSDYSGFLIRGIVKKSKLNLFQKFQNFFLGFFIGFIKIIKPRGKDASATRAFAFAIFFTFLIAIMNVFVKSGAISYEVYAFIFSSASLINYFTILLVYINNSPEPTTFMVKLVGISLVTILLVIGTISNVTLALSESGYDNERLAEIEHSKSSIIAKDFHELPETFQYISSRPVEGGLFSEKYDLIFTKDSNLSATNFIKNDSELKKHLVEEKIGKLRKKDKNISLEDATNVALGDIEKSKASLKTRRSRNLGKFFNSFAYQDKGLIYEVGFSYDEYRNYTHATALKLLLIIIGTTVLILLLFPLFFNSSLVKPLNDLLSGVTEVNKGDLDVVVSIKVQDEIGFLSGSFNSMVSSIKDAQEKLQDYADNLEEKVKERTREVQEKMEEIQALKIHQDGDYYLTSLLTKPLFFNANKSAKIKTDFLIKQKKTFEFRSKKADLGGDICVTGNLKFGTPDNFKRYTMVMNGDAMGKSMQGAGGSLVMGVVMNSIMARSAGNKRILDSTPEQWLTDIYHETNGVFKSFNGTMILSCVVAVIDDETGEMWYFNAEHPYTVLYRDGRACFIEEKLNLRKLGLDSEIDFQVFKYQLFPGDVVILGSDGRDDINLTPNDQIRTINEDETLFLKFVEEGKADIHQITELIKKAGEITDDLSFLRVGFKEITEDKPSTDENRHRTIAEETAHSGDSVTIDIDNDYPEEEENVEDYYHEAKKFLKEGNQEQALKELEAGYSRSHNNPKLNKLLALLSFKGKNYDTAVEVLGKYLEYDPDVADFWFYLSIAHKRLGKYESSLQAAEKFEALQPQNIQNLINLADLNRILGRIEDALAYQKKAIDLDPENRNAQKLAEILQKS